MTCDQAQPLLNAFADGELGWGTVWRVRRHLAGCGACASELAELRQLDARVRAWRDMPAPAGLQGRLAVALASAPPVVTPSPRRPLIVRRVAVGLAGMAVIATAFFWLTPGQPGRPTIAFADVEQAMQQVKTISWKTEVHYKGTLDQKSTDNSSVHPYITYTNWLRRDPPAAATTDFHEKPSHDFDTIKTLTDARGTFALSRIYCMVIPVLKISAQQTVENQIHRLTQFPQAEPSSKSAGQAQSTQTNFHQSYVVVNGQGQVRFDRDVKTVWPTYEGRTPYRLAHFSTWADPETHRIIRNELDITEDTSMGKGFISYVAVEDQFRYDQTPPKGTFNWSPPAGVRVVRM